MFSTLSPRLGAPQGRRRQMTNHPNRTSVYRVQHQNGPP